MCLQRSTGVHSASLCDDCLAGHKSFDHRGMAVLSGQVQGSVSFLVLNIDTGTLFGGEGKGGEGWGGGGREVQGEE